MFKQLLTGLILLFSMTSVFAAAPSAFAPTHSEISNQVTPAVSFRDLMFCTQTFMGNGATDIVRVFNACKHSVRVRYNINEGTSQDQLHQASWAWLICTEEGEAKGVLRPLAMELCAKIYNHEDPSEELIPETDVAI